jgi:hypothetical protein
MCKMLVAFMFAAAAPVIGLEPAAAEGNAPWCAIVPMDRTSVYEDCRYRTVEECVPNVLAGRRGFCTPNSAYVEPAQKPAKKQPRRR